jgi:hypothetical protein
MPKVIAQATYVDREPYGHLGYSTVLVPLPKHHLNSRSMQPRRVPQGVAVIPSAIGSISCARARPTLPTGLSVRVPDISCSSPNCFAFPMSAEEPPKPLLHRQKCLSLRGRTADDVMVTVLVYLGHYLDAARILAISLSRAYEAAQASFNAIDALPSLYDADGEPYSEHSEAPSSVGIARGPSHVTASSLSEYTRTLSTRARLTKSLLEALRSSTTSLPSQAQPIPLGNLDHPTAVELVFREALSAHIEVGAEFGTDPMKHFRKRRRRMDTPPSDVRLCRPARAAGPLLNPTHVGRMGITRVACVSAAAWLVSVCGLISLLAYLSFSFVAAKQYPAVSLTFTREERLRLPIITVCPSFSNAPLFPRGSSVQVKGLPPLVTISEVHLPVPPLSQIRINKYPRSLDNVEEVILGGGLRGPKSCEHNLTPQVLNSMQPALSSSMSGGSCTSCLRFGLLKPVHLESGKRHKVILNVAVNRLWSACQHDDPGGNSYFDDSVITWFIAIIASNLGTMLKKKYLTDPTLALAGAHGINLNNVSKQRAEFLFRPNSSDAQAGRDFFCNTLFASGLFYPGGSHSLPDIRYAWNSSAKFWSRGHGSAGPYWNVGETKAQDCTSVDTCPASADSVSNVHALRIYADDVSTLTADTYANSSTYLHMSDNNFNVDIAMRRKTHKTSVSVQAAVVTSHLIRHHLGQEYPFDVSSFVLYFDRFLTENVGETTVYAPWQFFLDVLNSVSLFTGLSFYTVS